MAKNRDVGNAGSDLVNNLEQDFNSFIRSTLFDLSREEDPRADTTCFAICLNAESNCPAIIL